jgi:hypothetical protein
LFRVRFNPQFLSGRQAAGPFFDRRANRDGDASLVQASSCNAIFCKMVNDPLTRKMRGPATQSHPALLLLERFLPR